MTSHLARQNRFTGGEIAPLAYGRTDSAAYQFGLRTAKNIICTLEGPAVNRSGTRYVCAVKDTATLPRLVSFNFTDGQNFILEIGDLYIRFVKDGAQVESAPGVPYELTAANGVPWAIADVDRLNFAQSGDVITVTCVNGDTQYQAYEIARISNTNWTVTAVSYSPQAYFAGAPNIPIDNIPRYELYSLWSAVVTYGFADIVKQGGHLFVSRVGGNLNHLPDIYGVNNTAFWTDLTKVPATGLAASIASAPFWSSTTTYSIGDFVLRQTPNNGTNPYLLYRSYTDGNTGNEPATLNNGWVDLTWSAGKFYAKGAYVWYSTTNSPTDGQLYVSQADGNWGNVPTFPNGNSYWLPASDSTRPPKQWQWVVTQLWADALGVRQETLPSAPTVALSIALYTDRPAQIAWSAESGGPASYTMLGYNIYRGRNGIYGFVGTTLAGARTFNDDGSAPDFGVQPPRGTNPFDVAVAGGGGTKTQSWPAVFTYHEQRALYARSRLKPQTFWGSAIGKYKVFDVNTPVQDSDAFEFKPQSEQLEEIRGLLSLEQLLLFTSNGVFNADGVNGPITASSIILRRSSNIGSSYLRPLIADEAALYYTINGRVRDLIYDWRLKKYRGHDVSVIARHLFEGHTITDWCDAETPYSLYWAVRDDGVLLSFTYSAGGEVEAWGQHPTVGRWERCASCTETDENGVTEDVVYVIAQRLCEGVATRYIERFSTRVIPLFETVNDDLTSTFEQDVRTCNFLDCSLEYDGRNTVAGEPGWATMDSVLVPGSTDPANYTAGAKIQINNNTFPFVAADAGDSVFVFDPDDVSGFGSFSATIVTFTDIGHVIAELEQSLTQDQVDAWSAIVSGDDVDVVNHWGIARKTITGLAHLNGQDVNALVDGAVAGPFTVAAGQITLGSAGVIVQVGLGYDSDLELLDLAAEGKKSNVKTVTQAAFEVVSSRGILAGETFDIPAGRTTPHLHAPTLQKVSDGNAVPPLFTGLAQVRVGSSWNTGARMCLRQSDPLPLTVVAAIRDVALGGR